MAAAGAGRPGRDHAAPNISVVTVDDAHESGATQGRAAPPPPVGFLELFYDLVFVAATMVLSNTFSANASWSGALDTTVVFGLLWLLWFHTTTLMNVERVDDFSHRALVLAQMFLISVTVLAFADKEASNNDLVGISYGLALAVVAFMHQRAIRRTPHEAAWIAHRRNRLVIAALAATSMTVLPDTLDNVVAVVLIALLVVPISLGRRRASSPPVDVHHLVERAALLTLIMCGEAFVKVALVVSEGSIDRADVVAVVVEFAVVFAIFFMYFDDIPKAGIRPGMVRAELWTLAHLPLQIGIVTVAVGISKYIEIGETPVERKVIVILSAGFVLVYGGLAVIGVLGERTPIAALTAARVGFAAIVMVLGAGAWFFGWFTPSGLLGALAVLAAVHVGLVGRLREETTVPVAH